MEKLRRTLTEAPTFGRSCEAAPESRFVELEVAGDDHDDRPMKDFEFAITFSSDPDAGEIFSDSRVLPVYPVFNQNLAADSFESSPTEADDPTAYCSWTPRSAPQSPNRLRMSQSAGHETSEFRRFRIRDLFFGRSRSDGKEKMFFTGAEKEMERGGFCPIPSRPAMKKGRVVKEMDVVTAHRMYYGKGAAVARRSFLPYRQGLIGGFFGHHKHQPFF